MGLIAHEDWYRSAALDREVMEVLKSDDLTAQYRLYRRTNGQGFPRGWFHENLWKLLEQQVIPGFDDLLKDFKTYGASYGLLHRLEESEVIKINYQEVVFAQGDDAVEPLQILDEGGEEAAVEYLKQWDVGETSARYHESKHGDSDYTYLTPDLSYLLSYSSSMGYVGLQYLEIRPGDAVKNKPERVRAPWLG